MAINPSYLICCPIGLKRLAHNDRLIPERKKENAPSWFFISVESFTSTMRTDTEHPMPVLLYYYSKNIYNMRRHANVNVSSNLCICLDVFCLVFCPFLMNWGKTIVWKSGSRRGICNAAIIEVRVFALQSHDARKTKININSHFILSSDMLTKAKRHSYNSRWAPYAYS